MRGWEKGEYAPRAEAVGAIARALDCEIGDLYETPSADDEEEAAAMTFDEALRLRVRQIMREELAKAEAIS